MIPPIEYADRALKVLDQRVLPHRVEHFYCHSSSDVARMITTMAVRGAPAIAIAGAYGMAIAALNDEDLALAYNNLLNSRPTAVHLKKILDHMMEVPRFDMLQEAMRLHREDLDINKRIGSVGSALLSDRCSVYHHCNTGALATTGWGTALGIVRSAVQSGKQVHVWVGETRPYLQGARLTAWELDTEHIPCTLVTDSMAAKLMADRRVDAILVGCDRVAANGDVANKIGTLSLAVLASYYKVPFYVAMPMSALDMGCLAGNEIPIEMRPGSEMLGYGGVQWASSNTKAYNPGFDVTPAKLVTAWVTELGLWRPR